VLRTRQMAYPSHWSSAERSVSAPPLSGPQAGWFEKGAHYATPPHDFLDEARRAIPEVSVEAVAARRTRGDEVVLLDVREKDEVRAGYIEGAITFQFEGQASVFKPHAGPCYRCLFPTPPPPGMVPSCSEVGVLGVLPGVIGGIQATETIKLIVGQGEPLVGRLVMYDALAMRFREIRIRRAPDCPLCGAHPTITALLNYEEFCGLDAVESATIGD
jgi:rhodanese-related sulfurtransferase